MERTLNYIEREIIKEGVHVVPEDPQVPMALPKDMIDMEAMYGKIEEELHQVKIIREHDSLTSNYDAHVNYLVGIFGSIIQRKH